MGVDIKAAKAEILEAGGEKPTEEHVRQDDIMDMMIREYFNPASRVPQDLTLNAIAMGASIGMEGEGLTKEKARAILEKYKP